ncbi:RNA splicing [Bonamia ostreae]|uniref:RNA splicing n=1 Tax=Bonamia ostreae TaxID=126728 RepID=A0ABV2ARX4_9EUKA
MEYSELKRSKGYKDLLEEKSEIGVKRKNYGLRKSDSKEERIKSAEHIPDTKENREVKRFLEKAPSKGLFQPLGKEVKIMQCWRCKNFGHRAADRECPFSEKGNLILDSERKLREDPILKKSKKILKNKKKSKLRSVLSKYLNK